MLDSVPNCVDAVIYRNVLFRMNTVISEDIHKDLSNDLNASAHEFAISAGHTLSTLVNANLRPVATTRRTELHTSKHIRLS